MNIKDTDIKKLLLQYKKICVYGLSPNPEKPSHQIPLFLRSKNYEVVGIYPNESSIAGIPIFPSLQEVPPDFRKFINVFQRPEKIPQIVEEILKFNQTEVLWLQLGITHPEAEAKAEGVGLKVVSDRCMLIEHKRNF